MTTSVIIDIVTAAVLLVFVIFGARHGLVRTLAGIVIIIVALVGAGMVAATFSAPAAKLVTPLIRQQVIEKVDAALEEQMAEAPQSSEGAEIDELLALLGMDEDVRKNLSEQAHQRVQEGSATLVGAVVESVVQSIMYGLLYIIAFLIFWGLLHILAKAMDLVTKLPGIHGLNAAAGAVLGFVKGALVLFLAVWALRRLGVSFETQTVEQTLILNFFATHTPLSVLSLLQ